MPNHTPAPWHFHHTTHRPTAAYVITANDRVLARVSTPAHPGEAVEFYANGLLMQAAPAMYEAMKNAILRLRIGLTDPYAWSTAIDNALRTLEAALAQAEGRHQDL